MILSVLSAQYKIGRHGRTLDMDKGSYSVPFLTCIGLVLVSKAAHHTMYFTRKLFIKKNGSKFVFCLIKYISMHLVVYLFINVLDVLRIGSWVAVLFAISKSRCWGLYYETLKLWSQKLFTDLYLQQYSHGIPVTDLESVLPIIKAESTVLTT